MSNRTIGSKYIVILSTYQFEWIKTLDGGIEELKKEAKMYDLYVQDYGKQRHKVIVNKKGVAKMKYIRTKQGNIYEVKSTYLDYFNCVYKFGTMEGIQFHKSVVLKKADTIEELCDGFVLEDKKENYEYRSRLLENLPCIYCYDKQNTTVYGGIWTKGEHGQPTLKPVAKMNEKGELELL